jgi:hypothetical protein
VSSARWYPGDSFLACGGHHRKIEELDAAEERKIELLCRLKAIQASIIASQRSHFARHRFGFFLDDCGRARRFVDASFSINEQPAINRHRPASIKSGALTPKLPIPGATTWI